MADGRLCQQVIGDRQLPRVDGFYPTRGGVQQALLGLYHWRRL